MANNHESSHSTSSSHGGHGHHLVPLPVYFRTLGALLVLTVLTVGASYVHFGSVINVIVCLGIASAKASLVLMYFMGLKYDSNLNRAFMLSSFAALFLLIAIGASDLWLRPQYKPVAVKSTEAPLSHEEFNALMVANDEQLAKGKKLYDVSCATCHGATGKGDGAGGASLNPKPRNFHDPAASWKNGPSFKSIYVTLAYGIPGSGMASYKALSPKDRIALTHYVLTLSDDKKAEAQGDGKFAQAQTEDGVGGAGAGAKTSLPIDFAIDRMIQN